MNKTILRSPVFTVVLFVLAAALLLIGTIGAVQAAPRTESNEYGAQVQLSDVHAAVAENGAVVSGDSLLKDLLSRAGDKTFVYGKHYDEVLAVRNTGSTDAYVRATVRCYWADKDGNKILDLDPGLIHLNFVEGGSWSIDTAASTPERTVLYYSSILAAGDTTPAFADQLWVDGQALRALAVWCTLNKQTEGVQFHVEVTADAVQTHNATAAMTSAWGRTN